MYDYSSNYSSLLTKKMGKERGRKKPPPSAPAKEPAKSTRYWEETDDKQGLCLDETYRALRALPMEDADEALKEALRARELAKLRFTQGHKEEAERIAKEALGIADRCGYRLKQADIHNFLAEYYIDSKDLAKAKGHLETAKEQAACGYQPALDKANQLTQLIQA